MTRRDELDPNSPGYTNALLEDIDSKFQAVLEATQPIGVLQEKLDKVLSWEESVNLIPVIFEEVGTLRRDVDILKEAMKLLNRHEERLTLIERRLEVVEQKIAAR